MAEYLLLRPKPAISGPPISPREAIAISSVNRGNGTFRWSTSGPAEAEALCTLYFYLMLILQKQCTLPLVEDRGTGATSPPTWPLLVTPHTEGTPALWGAYSPAGRSIGEVTMTEIWAMK
jgi:hypothetical protein